MNNGQDNNSNFNFYKNWNFWSFLFGSILALLTLTVLCFQYFLSEEANENIANSNIIAQTEIIAGNLKMIQLTLDKIYDIDKNTDGKIYINKSLRTQISSLIRVIKPYLHNGIFSSPERGYLLSILSSLKIDSSSLSEIYKSRDFSYSDLSGYRLKYADFYNIDFSYSCFYNFECIGCNFNYSKFSRVCLKNKIFKNLSLIVFIFQIAYQIQI